MGLAAAAGIAAVATVGGAVISSHAAGKAANAQQAAAEAGVAEQHRQYDQTRADFAPWRAAGGAAITNGAAMLQPGYDYTTSPGYQFRMDEGLRGVQNSAAAKGLLQSGGTLKGILGYSQGLAAQDFNDQFNRQMAVAAGGQQANTATASAGQASAQNIGSLLTQAGNAKASGYVGQANAWTGALNNLGSIAGMYGGGFGGGGGGSFYNGNPQGIY
jgi:hypothetical protein